MLNILIFCEWFGFQWNYIAKIVPHIVFMMLTKIEFSSSSLNSDM